MRTVYFMISILVQSRIFVVRSKGLHTSWAAYEFMVIERIWSRNIFASRTFSRVSFFAKENATSAGIANFAIFSLLLPFCLLSPVVRLPVNISVSVFEV